MNKLALLMEKNKAELAAIEALDNGPSKLAPIRVRLRP